MPLHRCGSFSKRPSHDRCLRLQSRMEVRSRERGVSRLSRPFIGTCQNKAISSQHNLTVRSAIGGGSRERRKKKEKKKKVKENKRKRDFGREEKKCVKLNRASSSRRRHFFSTRQNKTSSIGDDALYKCVLVHRSDRSFHFQSMEKRFSGHKPLYRTTDAGFEGKHISLKGLDSDWPSGPISIFIQHLHGASPSVSVGHLFLSPSTSREKNQKKRKGTFWG